MLSTSVLTHETISKGWFGRHIRAARARRLLPKLGKTALWEENDGDYINMETMIAMPHTAILSLILIYGNYPIYHGPHTPLNRLFAMFLG